MKNTPALSESSFQCPHCNIVASQHWINLDIMNKYIFRQIQNHHLDYRPKIYASDDISISKFIDIHAHEFSTFLNNIFPDELSFSRCQSCYKKTIWFGKNIIYPATTPVAPPNADMDSDIQSIYNEAASIVNNSPKGAAALLRLALQKLMVQLGEDGNNLNQNIKNLVSKGLHVQIQQSLDYIRVIGNNAVHPGNISLDDDRHIAINMFKMLNLIVEDMISKPKEINELYDEIMPEDTKQHIEKRDAK